MAEILTRCPETGRAISTGLTTESVIFESLPKVPVPVKCPDCGEVHKWTTATAWVSGEETDRRATE
jgi:hypothetical protein